MAINESIMGMARRFAGADPDEDDAVLEMCYRAAVAWYERAGVPKSGGDLYQFWVANLAAWFYDPRVHRDQRAPAENGRVSAWAGSRPGISGTL